ALGFPPALGEPTVHVLQRDSGKVALHDRVQEASRGAEGLSVHLDEGQAVPIEEHERVEEVEENRPIGHSATQPGVRVLVEADDQPAAGVEERSAQEPWLLGHEGDERLVAQLTPIEAQRLHVGGADGEQPARSPRRQAGQITDLVRCQGFLEEVARTELHTASGENLSPLHTRGSGRFLIEDVGHGRPHSGLRAANPSSSPCQYRISVSPYFQHRFTTRPSLRYGKSTSPIPTSLMTPPSSVTRATAASRRRVSRSSRSLAFCHVVRSRMPPPAMARRCCSPRSSSGASLAAACASRRSSITAVRTGMRASTSRGEKSRSAIGLPRVRKRWRPGSLAERRLDEDGVNFLGTVHTAGER